MPSFVSECGPASCLSCDLLSQSRRAVSYLTLYYLSPSGAGMLNSQIYKGCKMRT